MNLRQSFKGTEFPFMWLDPELCWHGGFFWWEKKLRDVITIIAHERFNGKYLDALRDLSKRLAQIELVPYHSQSFHGHGLLKTLPSVLAAKRYVRETLIPQASKGEKTIIVTRQEACWDLPNNTKNLVIYRGGQTRGASLSPTSPGGKAILKRYDIASS